MLSDLLDNDEDLFVMNISRLWEEPHLWHLPLAARTAIIDEIEILLESFELTVTRLGMCGRVHEVYVRD